MAERPPFPKKETELRKQLDSCESMAEMRAAAPPLIKHNDLAGRPPIMMSPASSTFSSSFNPLLPFISASQLNIADQQYLQGSLLIPNPNPNSIGNPNPSTNASLSALSRITALASNSLNYHSNQTYDSKVGSCRFKKAEQSPTNLSATSRGLAERLPHSSAQPIKELHHQMQVDDLGLASSEDQMMTGQFGLLAAHAYSPWIISWPADDQYQETAEEGISYRVKNTGEENPTNPTAGSPQPPSLSIDRDRLFSPLASPPVSPPSQALDVPSSPSSSASELHNASSSFTPPPLSADNKNDTTNERGDATLQATAPTDNTPPLKKQRRKGQKRVREARVALLTKSEVEHLEDGYRWRKYGQKAVKNSPHPRSYYRCTNSKCFVKKRVERCSEDPSLVVTTYEGQHTHHSPALLRGSILSDPNYPNLYSTANVTFVPWQSSPINPNLNFPSTLAQGQLLRNQLPARSLPAPNVLQGFPHMTSTSLSFPMATPTSTLSHANLEKIAVQPHDEGRAQAGKDAVINSRHYDFMQAIDASQQQLSASLAQYAKSLVASATILAGPVQNCSAPFVDRGLLHDMLPVVHDPCMRNMSPPSSSS
ncbi:hypothetical protein L7F22_052383 [Adiantum nelumboides]|nr:hypothetical protein [Adiantum nelumboides]